jgi:hypothetical protein
MDKLLKKLIIIILFLFFNGCSSLYVTTTMNKGVQPHVKKEMIKNHKRLNKQEREIYKIHKQRRREIKRAQQKSWKQ